MADSTALPGLAERALLLYARRFPIRRGKLRVVNRMWRFSAGGRGFTRIAVLKYGRFRVPCDLSQMLQRQFYFFGTYFVEERLLDCWAACASRSKIVFDIGANAGIYSLAALAACRDAQVHAFEPTPEIAERLRLTAHLNGLALKVHQMAVSDRTGEAVLERFAGETGANEGMNFIRAVGSQDGERVGTVRLDEFCRARGIEAIDLMKVDVQGHEYPVLLGAGDMLSLGRIKTILMELNWSPDPAACVVSRSIRLLTDAGYKFADPLRAIEWREPGPWMRILDDVLARFGAE